MKARHMEWAKLGTKKSTIQTKTVIRVLDLPGFVKFEDHLLLYSDNRGGLTPELEGEADVLSKKVFGIRAVDTEYEFPEEYWDLDETDPKIDVINTKYDEHESRFETKNLNDDEKVEALLKLGFDFRDDQGRPLRCTRYFSLQAEAVAKGIMGKMPDISAARERRMQESLAKEAQQFLAKRRRS